jgi:DNA-3-methyladenine glycosylase II
MSTSVRTLTVPVRAPYRLDLTANALRRLSTNVVDVYDGATYRRLIGDPVAPVLLEVIQTTPDTLTARVHGKTAFDVEVLVRRMFGVDVDLSPFYRDAAKVPWLGTLVDRARGVKPPRYPSLWETIVNAVVYQQISIHAAAAILRRVIERYAVMKHIDGENIAAFPGPVTFVAGDIAELRSLGLSVNKVTALRALAKLMLDGALAEDKLELLATADIVAHLVAFPGIGPWTAAVIALRGYGRLDIFPMKDSGVARTLKDLSGDPDVDAAAILTTLGDQRGMLYYHLLLGRLAARGDVVL